MSKWRRHRSLKKRWRRGALINKYGAVCYYCEIPFVSMKEVTLDHAVPLSRGGSNELDNLRLAHLSCNQLKNDMTAEEFELFQNE